MLLKHPFKKIKPAPMELVNELADYAIELDWNKEELNRPSKKLVTKFISYPLPTRKENEQPLSEEFAYIQQQLLPKFIDWISQVFNNYIIFKFELACVLPNQELAFHVDPNLYHQKSHRMHIPIITNAHSLFHVEKENWHLPVGYVYEVNNRKYHAVSNHGEHIRIHLVFDIMEKSIYQECLENKLAFEDKTFPFNCFTHREFYDRYDFIDKNYS